MTNWFRDEAEIHPAHDQLRLPPYAEVRPLLEAVDHPTEWEFPPGFDWEAAMSEVRRLKADLEALLGTELVMDEGVQDASFFTELGTPDWNLRFSMFGRLVTLWHWREPSAREVSVSDCEQVIARLYQWGYVYVDPRHLIEPYTGCHTAGEWHHWWGRYFDYN
jgi:hypothetical protein